VKELKGKDIPTPIGTYSIAIISNGLIFLSGQIPIKNGEIYRGDFKEQVRIVLENSKKILETAGSSLEKVVKVTVFMKNLERFSELNEVYSEFFKPPYPARSVVEVSRLPKDVDVEIEMIAEVS
jgi:2-iminobutanoate/2-iminopropanoate deaminase